MSGQHIIKHVTVVDVGTPPTTGYSYEEQKTVEVHFHEFARLSERTSFESRKFACFGRRWVLQIYPGGDEDSDPGKVAVFLRHCSPGSIDLEYGFSVKNSDGKQMAHWEDEDYFEGKSDYFGNSDFAKHSKMLYALVEGTLIIEVSMKLIEATDTPVPPFIPENPLCKNILKKFMHEKSADVFFEVGTELERGRGARKKAKTTPTTLFYAHHLILQDCAPDLADLCRSGEKSFPIPITDIKPEIFRHILYYIYGGKLEDDELEANAKDIINAADRYGVVNLKLEAEACYAKSTTLTVDNILDNLLYADAKNCALLKEVVMDFIVENGKDIIGKVSFEDVPSTMMTDLLTAMTRGKKKDDDSSEEGEDYGTMRVSTLRRKLHEQGLDIDGSRETMIALVKENS